MNHRSNILVPVALKTDANALAHSIGIDPAGKLNTVSVPCVPASGPADAEPTYYGCSGQVTDAQREALQAQLAAFPGTFWWRTGALDNIVLASSQSGDIGKSMTFDDMLASVWLKRQVQSIA